MRTVTTAAPTRWAKWIGTPGRVNSEAEGTRPPKASGKSGIARPAPVWRITAPRTLLRRRGPTEGEADVLRFEDLSLDLSTRDAHRGDRTFTLTRVEFDLLELLLAPSASGAHPRGHLGPGLGLQLRHRDQLARGVRGLPAPQAGGGRRAPPAPDGPRRRVRPSRAVTFRTRVAAAIAVVVAVAVLLACGAAYKAARDALDRLVGRLARPGLPAIYLRTPAPTAARAQLAAEPTSRRRRAARGRDRLPAGRDRGEPTSAIDATIRQVAAGTAPLQFRTVTRRSTAPSTESCSHRSPPAPSSSTSSSGQHTSSTLATTSALVHRRAVPRRPVDGCGPSARTSRSSRRSGVLLAALFGWLAARAALGPARRDHAARSRTVATTLDVSHRVEEGTNDELGRLRRAFNKLLAQRGAVPGRRSAS